MPKTPPRPEELRTLRRYLRMSQAELGTLLQLGGTRPGQMISRYERGVIPLPGRVLKAVKLLVMALDKEEGDSDLASAKGGEAW